MNFAFRPTLIASTLACLSATVQAQAIDQFDVRRVGNDAVLQLRFASEIQFQRSFSTRAGDLTVISYALVRATNAELRATQGLRLGPPQGLPNMTLADEPASGERGRKITLRAPDGTRLKVRAGQGNRSIEIVVIGAGAGVSAQAAPARPAAAAQAAPGAARATFTPVTPATLPAADRQFVIVLQSSTDAATRDATMIPRTLQNYEVFTSERVADGVKYYETRVGYFTTRTQAEALLLQLSAFPQATIVATASTPIAPTVVAAAKPAAAPAPAVASAPSAAASAPEAAPTPLPPAAPPVAAAAPAPGPAPAGTTTAAAEPQLLTPEEVETRSNDLFTKAQAAMAQQNHVGALEVLNELLNLPPNRNTQAAQEMAGLARARSGDLARARIEFESYLQLYPQGEGSNRVRAELALLPAAVPAAPVAATRPEVETTVTGSSSMYYYGGNGHVRSQDFKDSAVAGVPRVAADPLFTDDKSQQLFNDVDLTWRQRNADSDMRFVFRDSYTTDLERSDKSKNRLSALYFDYKSLTGGYTARLGRQSPTGGGVMGRFDGVSASYLLRPKLKLGAVAGQPTDKYFESNRKFYGMSLDADGVLPNFGAGVYVIQQTIDGEIDRRGLGLEMRYFNGGASIFSQFDYDTLIKGINIATVQGTFITEGATVFNALYDRRALTMLTLGNALTFEDPANPGVLYSRIADKLATTTLLALREQIKRTTPFITQAQLGVTTPIDKTWQVGMSGQLTSTGAIPPVPDVVGFENGRPATGNIYSVSAQLIGLNLYSSRDTHVFSSTAISSPDLKGFLLSYNNSSIAWDVWQVEPSLQFYRDRNTVGSTNQRWTPGMRLTFRGWKRWAVESNLTYELGTASRVTADPTDPTLTVSTKESSNRVNYSLGARFEF